MSVSDDPNITPEKTGLKESFLKSQATSVASTTVDFSVLLLCTELLGIYYVNSKGIAALCGAIVGFFLGRNWAFRSKAASIRNQSLKYIFTSAISWYLNVKGIYFLTEYYDLHYFVSNVIVAILVAVFFNFVMYRYFVFK